MRPPVNVAIKALVACSISFGATAHAYGQSAANVMVVINESSPESVRIGEYYVAKRNIPAANIVRLSTAVADDMDRAHFEYEIERPISVALTRNGTQDQILYIVLTKGIPLRVTGSSGLQGSVASVDSELTLLYRKLLGNPSPPPGRLPNPYYLDTRSPGEAKRFSHLALDIYLVTRLDGFTVDDVIGLIDRGAAPGKNGVFVLDQRASLFGNRIGDDWLESAAQRLTTTTSSSRVMLEATKSAAAATQPALGYYSWGSNDPAITRRAVDVKFSPGALAGMFVSTDARTFTEPPSGWNVGTWGNQKTYFGGSPQSLTGDLVRAGVTGVAGHVAEPFLDGSARPQILFPAYLEGFNLAESFYLAIPYLSWQNIVIGDPLCSPFSKGDIAASEITPRVDPETELPEFFSARRLAVLHSYDVRPEIATLMLKASARLLHADLPGAAQALEAVTALDPSLNAAHFVLASIYDASGQHDRAIERYRAILATNPNDVRSLNNLAYALAVNKGQAADALPHAVKAYSLAFDPDTELVLDLGYALAARKGTPPNVLPFAPVGYDKGATRAQIADTLGWVYHLLHNNAEAYKHIAAAAEGATTNAEVQFHLAVVEAEQGRHKEATVALNKAIELDPKLADRNDVKQLRAKLQKP